MLDQTAILRTLAAHRDELRMLGAQKLALFGSYARNTATEASDVDVLVDLKPKTLDNYMRLKFRLEELLGRPVDLVLREEDSGIHPRARARYRVETDCRLAGYSDSRFFVVDVEIPWDAAAVRVPALRIELEALRQRLT